MTILRFTFREETESVIIVVALRAHCTVIFRYWSILVSPCHESYQCRHACLVTRRTTSSSNLCGDRSFRVRQRTASVHLRAWIFLMALRSFAYREVTAIGELTRRVIVLSLSRCEPCFSSQLDLPISGYGHPDLTRAITVTLLTENMRFASFCTQDGYFSVLVRRRATRRGHQPALRV